MKGLVGRRKPLTERDLEVLGDLQHASDYAFKQGWRDGYVRVMDCGGTNGSHHGATLAKLFSHGLALRRRYGRIRLTALYKIAEAGRARLKETKEQKK